MRASTQELGAQNTEARDSASEVALDTARYSRSLHSTSRVVPALPSLRLPAWLGPENTKLPAMNGFSSPSNGMNWRLPATTPWNAGASGMATPRISTGVRSCSVMNGLSQSLTNASSLPRSPYSSVTCCSGGNVAIGSTTLSFQRSCTNWAARCTVSSSSRRAGPWATDHAARSWPLKIVANFSSGFSISCSSCA